VNVYMTITGEGRNTPTSLGIGNRESGIGNQEIGKSAKRDSGAAGGLCLHR